jgi:hypothetical protein
MAEYDIDIDGNFYKDGKKGKQSNHNKGYKVISMGGKMKYIHRLLAEKYIPNPNNYCCVNHKNGVKHDNRIENLEWITNRDNLEHARLNGFSEPKQLGIPSFTKQQVYYILEQRDAGRTYVNIAKEMNRDGKTIWRVCNGKSYKDFLEQRTNVLL